MAFKRKILVGFPMAALLSVVSLAAGSEARTDLRLVEAAKNKDQISVRSLIRQHLDVNAAQPDGATALHWAAHWNDLETADFLIHAGANVNAATDHGITTLSLACADRGSAMVEKLLDAGANPNAAESTGETPLMTCVRTGDPVAVKSLLDHGADVNAKESSHDQTALMWAISRREKDIVAMLLESKADAHARTKSGYTPLLFAAQEGDLDSLRTLLAAGANVNEAANDGMTPLLVASANGYQAMLAFLLDNGAAVNAADSRGFTALHYCASRRNNMLPSVKLLLAHGANPNLRLVKNNPTRHHDSYQLSRIGATPLLLAGGAGNVDVMKALVAGGADPKITTDQGTTLLMVAAGVALGYRANKNGLEAVKLAIELGNDVNAAGEGGWTALHGAAYTGLNEAIKLLVAKGANLDAKDNFGQTPLTIAEALITVGPSGIPGMQPGIKPVFVLKDTANLLLQLGATPVEASGVKVWGFSTVPELASQEP